MAADIMQPDLDSFQPSFGEELMDTFEAPPMLRFGELLVLLHCEIILNRIELNSKN